MNIICLFIYFFLSTYIFFFNRSSDIFYIFGLFLLLLYRNTSNINSNFIYIITYILILVNILYIYKSNFHRNYINIPLLLITYLYLLSNFDNLYNFTVTNSVCIFITTIIIFFLLNFTIKLNKLLSKIEFISNDNNKIVNIRKNIRVALCVSGKIDGNIEKIYNSWKENLLNFYNVDIFMNIDKSNDYINNIIKPIKCVIFNESININNDLNNNTNLMLYRIYETNKYTIEYEKNNNIKYDLIIRIRSDILLFERLYLENFKPNTIYFPIKDIFDMTNIYNLGITDQLFISDRVGIDIISNIYMYIDKNNNINKFNKITCKFPEILLLYYLKINKVSYKFFYYKWMINYYFNNSIESRIKLYSRIYNFFNSDCFINL
jgi:hypothetical protein